jgi:hypothetical protein
MPVDDASQLLDHIYEAAAVPDKWPDVLDRLAQMAGAVGTLSPDHRSMRWTSSESMRRPRWQAQETDRR